MAVGSDKLVEFFAIKGLRIGVAEAAIKYPNRKDLVVFELAENSTCAGIFTTNKFCAAPVHLCKAFLAKATPRYFIVNTGNANAGTGQQGFADAQACCDELAALTGVDVEQILPFSTGVIGEKLPTQNILNGLPTALQNLADNHWVAAAEGIMTTDTRPKGATRQISVGQEVIAISGISKGAGMIMPNMATMLAFVATDATVEPALLQRLLKIAADKSFNRITIDGDTSTNDACMLVATGQSNAPVITESSEYFIAFVSALESIFIELSQAIVKDGEGATKFVTLSVESAASADDAREVAYTIAHSPLVKTALFACDPNWGRILAAIGRAKVSAMDVSKINLWLNGVCVLTQGEPASTYTEAAGQAVLDQDEIVIRVELNQGQASETLWTTDLSHEYVRINAEYRS